MTLLYKYFPARRIQDVSSRLVRFTQPAAFNDPFEAEPVVGSLGDPVRIRGIIRTTILADLEGTWNSLPAEIRDQLPLPQFKAHVEADPESRVDGMLAYERSIADDMTRRMTTLINSTVGFLSLSEVPDHLLMWSHYADAHRGFAVGYDASHSFFKAPGSEPDDIVGLKQIVYAEARPNVSWQDLSATDAFLTKSTHWSYEREWRCIAYLRHATVHVDAIPKIYLFRLPADAIHSVVFGCRMRRDDRDLLAGGIRRSPELNHVSLLQARMAADSFALDIDLEPM